MLTMKELYNQWSTENPYHFQQTLLKSFSGICNRFHFLCDLPYDSISQEMLDALYSTAPDKDTLDRMRYLIGRLDVYVQKQVHPSIRAKLSKEKAVWMILREPSALSNMAICDLVSTIASQPTSTFDQLAALYIMRENSNVAEATANYCRSTCLAMENICHRIPHEITDEEYQEAIDSLSEWRRPVARKLINVVKELANENKYATKVTDIDRLEYSLDISLSELHQLWLRTYNSEFTQNSLNTLNIAWNVIAPLSDTAYRDIRPPDIQLMIVSKPATTQYAVKRLYLKLDHFAYALDIVNRERARMLVVNDVIVQRRSIFSEADIENLKAHIGEPGVDVTLVLIYTGLRAGELAGIRKTDVNLALREMRGGNKSKWSINRLIPIHSVIYPIICKWMDNYNEFLIHYTNGTQARNRLIEENITMASSAFCKSVHIPHECRHTFYTRLEDAGVSSSCISQLVGHCPKGVGERVYTHITPQQLKNAVNRLS